MDAAETETERAESDKLRDGPCAKPYLDLEDCAADKNVRSHRVSRRRSRRRRRRRYWMRCVVRYPLSLVVAANAAAAACYSCSRFLLSSVL